MSRRSNARLARLQSRVRFGPQEQALAGVLLAIQDNYKTQVRQARGAAAATQAAVGAARPEIRAAYRRAGTQRQAVGEDIAPFLAQLGTGGSAGIVRAGIGRERALGATHMAEAEAASLGELARRKVQAASGGQYGVRAAGDQLRADTLKTAQQLSALAGQKGAFTAATLESLAAADKKLGVQKRGQNITKRGQDLSHADRQASARRQAAKDAKAKHGKNRITADAQGAAMDNIRVAVNAIKQFGGKGGIPSTDLRRMLESGYKTKGGTTIPKIGHAGPITAHDLINAAFDIAVHGRLSVPNRRALRGVHVPAPWKRPMPRRPRTGSAVGGAIRF